MSDAKYSILFMRDDRDVTRYRISPFWLKTFVFWQIIMLVAAAGGIYLGVREFRLNAGLQTENKSLEQRLVDAEVRLEPLGNMEKILQSYDPAELESLLSAATSELEEQQQQIETPSVDLSSIFSRVDTRTVGVENLQAKVSGRQVSVSFELNNLQSSKGVIGQIFLELVQKDGTAIPAKAKKSDLQFQIQRFKRIKTAFSMPEGVEEADLFGLRVEIKGKGGDVIFSETYPFYNILS